MSAADRIISEPTWYIEWLVAALAFLAGLYLTVAPWFGLERAAVSPSFVAAAVSTPALVFYGLLMCVIGVMHLISLVRPLWPRSSFWRRQGTLLYFILFGYFTAIRILTYPSRVIWLALLFTTVVVGLCHIRLRLVQ